MGVVLGTRVWKQVAVGGELTSTSLHQERACKRVEAMLRTLAVGLALGIGATAHADIEKVRLIPADARSHCVQTNVYMPSYIEWLTCFEMEIDVRKMRADDAKAAQAKAAPQRGRSPAARTRPCPIVEFQSDGSILSVDNC